MICETINFTDDGRVNLRTYIHDESDANGLKRRRPAIIIMPGGAFSYLAAAEGEPVALTFLAKGFNTFVMSYSVGDYCKYPDVLEEISKAIREVRSHADEWNIDPDAIVLMGFSAGACMAALSATQWNTPGLCERLGVSFEDIKPNAAVIAYAPWDNTNTIQRDPEFFNPNAAAIAKDCTPELDFINYAGTHMPPMFIWHNRYDKFVPAINPVMIAAKLYELKLPFELHIFQGGEHGMSVCNSLSSFTEEKKKLCEENPNVGLWVPMCENWINKLFIKDGE